MRKVIPVTLSSGGALFSLVFIDGGRLSGDVDGCSLDSAGEIRIDSEGWGTMRINSLCTASQADSTLLCKTLNSSCADGFFRFIPYDLNHLLSKSLPENRKRSVNWK